MAIRYIAFFLLISMSQVYCDEELSVSALEEFKTMLSSVNKTINQLYQMMETQQKNDREFLDSKIDEAMETLRKKRDAPEGEQTEALDKLAQMFEGLKGQLASLASNISETDAYKKLQSVGEDLKQKTLELGSKVQETINNMKV